MEETGTAPPPKLGIEQLFRLQDMFMSRLLELSRKAIVTKDFDAVSIHVNAVKLKELQNQIKAKFGTNLDTEFNKMMHTLYQEPEPG